MVTDEPLYAHDLAETGLDHPGRDEVNAAGETDWRRVVVELVGPLAQGIRADFLRDPKGHLEWLCDLVGVPFSATMLTWPASSPISGSASNPGRGQIGSFRLFHL